MKPIHPAPQSTPAPDMPRLSAQNARQAAPDRCQACGQGATSEAPSRRLIRWEEHNEHDQPEGILVILCPDCSDRLIAPHPRLYGRVDSNAPWPGAMALCLDCHYRHGIVCRHHNAKANGGQGLPITIAEPMRGFVDGRDYRGPFTSWPSPATACAGHEPLP